MQQPTTKTAKEPAFEGIRRFFRNVAAELKKVNWPNRKELITYTIVVIVTVLVVSLILTFWDALLSATFSRLGFYGQ
jgi:preprotein translocase subunit SecE